MPLVQAWKCPHTGTLFDHDQKGKYQKHLKVLSRQRCEERQRKKKTDEWGEFLADAQETIKTPDELSQWILDNQKVIIARHNFGYATSTYKTYKIESLHFSIRWQKKCSNTHCCPKDGVQNWGCKDGKPLGYPGFYGSVVGEVSGRTQRAGYFDSKILAMLNIHTGSGGGGEKFRYSLTIWEDDWPGMREHHRMIQFEKKISTGA